MSKLDFDEARFSELVEILNHLASGLRWNLGLTYGIAKGLDVKVPYGTIDKLAQNITDSIRHMNYAYRGLNEEGYTEEEGLPLPERAVTWGKGEGPPPPEIKDKMDKMNPFRFYKARPKESPD